MKPVPRVLLQNESILIHYKISVYEKILITSRSDGNCYKVEFTHIFKSLESLCQLHDVFYFYGRSWVFFTSLSESRLYRVDLYFVNQSNIPLKLKIHRLRGIYFSDFSLGTRLTSGMIQFPPTEGLELPTAAPSLIKRRWSGQSKLTLVHFFTTRKE